MTEPVAPTNIQVTSKAARPRRRWLQFSLRTFLLLITVFGIWLGIKVNAARRQQEAVRAILQAGGTIDFDYQMSPVPGKPGTFTRIPNASPPGPGWLRNLLGEEFFRDVVGVSFDNRRISRDLIPSDLTQLTKLPELKTLRATDLKNGRGRIRRPKEEAGSNGSALLLAAKHILGVALTKSLIDDTGMVEIGKLTSFEELYLDNDRISDGGLKFIQSLAKLQELSLNNTDVTSDGLKYLRPKRLRLLSLQQTDVDDAGLELIGNLTSLQTLLLDGTFITDAGLRHLEQLTSLQTLCLSQTDISDAALRNLNSPQLRSLTLHNTRVGDSSLEQIGKCALLESLQLDSTLVTDAGLKHLRNLANLETLSLAGAEVTDAGLQNLSGLGKLKSLNLEGTRVTFEGVTELQKSLPKTVIAAITAPPPTQLTGAAPNKAFIASRMTEWEKVAAAPLRDEFGARWKIRVPSTSRKANLLGRAAPFAMNGEYIPFKDYLAHRNLESGEIQWQQPIRLPSAPEQIVGNLNGIVCVLVNDEKSGGADDVLYFDHFSMGGSRGATGIRLNSHTEPPWRLLMSPNRNSPRRLVSCSDDGSIRLWELDEREQVFQQGPNGRGKWVQPARIGDEIAHFPGYGHDEHGGTARGEFVAFSPYGQWLATAYQHKVTFRSPVDGSEKFSWEADLPDSQRITAIRFSHTGNTLLAFLENAHETTSEGIKFLQFYLDLNQVLKFTGTHGVVDGQATVDGQYVITWDGSGEVVFWDLEQGIEIAAVNVAPQHVYDVAFSPTGDVMATAGDDGEAKFWKIADHTRVETKRAVKHPGVDLIQFASNGKLLFTGSDDGWLKCWDAPEFTWDDGHTRPITTEFRNDGMVRETYPDGTATTMRKQ